MEGDNCLVCFEPSSGPELGQQPHNYDDDDSRLLSNQTFAKIFNLSTGQKTRLIQNSPSIYTCSKCSGQLQQIHQVYEELKVLEDHLTSLKDSLKNTIVSSFVASESNDNGNGLVHSIREEIVKGQGKSQPQPDDDSDLDEPNFSKYQFKPEIFQVIKKDNYIFTQDDLVLEHDNDIESSFNPLPPLEVESSISKPKPVQNKKTTKKTVQENNEKIEEESQRKSKRKKKPSRKILDEVVDDLPKDPDPDYEPELEDLLVDSEQTGENDITNADEDLDKFCLQIQPSLILTPIPFRKKNRSISVQDDLIKKFIEKEKYHLKEQHKLRLRLRLKKPKRKDTREPIAQCPHCFRYLCTPRALRGHLKSVHGVIVDFKREPCTECDPIRYFPGIKGLESHKKLRHSCPEPIIVVNSDDNNNKFYICPEPSCSKQFKSDHYYRDHYKMIHDPDQVQLCVDCGKTFKNPRYLKNHIVRNHPKNNEQFICDQCSSVFKSKVALGGHLKYQHGPLKFKCQHRGCHKAFHINSRLQEHEIQEHLKEKRFECEQCPSKFFLGSQLREHMKRMHTNVDPQVICQTCGKNFRQSYIIVHQKHVHEKEFHHFCHLCNKGFYRMNELNVHIKYHPGKNHLKCPFPGCDSTFSTLSSLSIHKRKVHHMETHKQLLQKSNSDSETYSCRCGVNFKIKRHLLNHKKKFGH